MSPISKEFSSKITNMSLWGAFLVVSIHCGFSNSGSGVGWFLDRVFSSGYSQMAVPFFFLVSGYFLAAHVGETGWWGSEIKKRVKSVLIPFFTWSLLYQVLSIPFSLYADSRAGRPLGTSVYILHGDLLSVFGLKWDQWPASVTLWFLRSLFLFALVSPLVLWMLRKAARAWIAILFAGSIALTYAPDPVLGGWSGFCQRFININGLMYFSIGMFARITDVHYHSRRSALVGLVVGLLLLVSNGAMAHFSMPLKLPLACLATPCLMYATWHFMPAAPVPSWLKGTSFPIYLMHPLVLSFWGFVMRYVDGDKTMANLTSWPLAFAASIALANILKRASPVVHRFLFGSR